jgi:hypothetical protein
MKTPEDEAWEEMERKQGAGGFPAKRAMARARIEDDDDTQDYKRPWVGLTDDELADLWYKESLDWMEFARAHEAALKEKNSG